MTDQIIKNTPLSNLPKEVLWLSAIIVGVVVLSLALLVLRFYSVTYSPSSVKEFLSKNPTLKVDLQSNEFLTRETARQTISDFALKSNAGNFKKEDLLVGVIRPSNVASKIAILLPGETAIFKDANGKEHTVSSPWYPLSPSMLQDVPIVYAFRKKQ